MYRGPYETETLTCPYCGMEGCEADYVDVGIGLVQCGPHYCTECGASSVGPFDTRELTDREKETRWYEPNSPVSELANTFHGTPVDHRTAKKLYDLGLLDPKP